MIRPSLRRSIHLDGDVPRLSLAALELELELWELRSCCAAAATTSETVVFMRMDDVMETFQSILLSNSVLFIFFTTLLFSLDGPTVWFGWLIVWVTLTRLVGDMSLFRCLSPSVLEGE